MTYMMKKHTTTFQFRPDGIKSLLLMLLLMMTVGATGAWGETDYSGTYFIANGNGYSSTNAANNFYLVPATNANYATDQPHLTTTKSGQVLNCCWRIVKSGDYYRIIHVADGKYLTANPAMAGTSGNDVGRLRVHLQEFADIAADTDGNTLFEIKVNSKGEYNIRHKDMSDKINNSTTTYLDPAGGNVDGTNLTSGRTASTSNGKVNVGGGIGYWTDEAAARWRFEEVPQNNTYTYNIVDCSGRIAIKYTTGADQPAAKALSSYTDIPAAIRSPYLNGETVKFYTFSGAFDADNLTDENKIAATPVADNANIYVTYTTDRLSEKFLRLRGARAFNFVTNDGYAYDNGGTLAYDNVETNKTQTNHLWNISGGDPYAVQIKNLGTHKYLVSSTMPTLSLAETATNNFILMEQSAAADAGSESVMLMKATGTEDLVVTKAEFQASPVNITTKYYLIDKAGKLIQGNIESESSELGLPDEWRSPLVSEYHYYKTSGYNETTQTYTPADPITSPFEAGADGNIYVTYDVSDAVDLTGGKTYLLKFSGGEYFHQEDGHDGINKEGYTDYGVTSATKAIYPYNNGDFNLYVYGQEQWEAQLASGASTRSRWLWYIISSHDGTPLTGNDIDPYHVVIKSYQNHTVKDKIDKNDVNSGDKNYGPGSSYLQTYKPSDYASVITNIAYENENYSSAYNEKMPTSIVNGQPTEYMILGTSIQNMTLKTFNEVEGERRTVNSFEQYWKNNPTVKTLAGVANPAADNATLTEMGWHQFTSWAYSAPWDNSTKGLAEGTHWYQTISMGSGNFTVEEVSLTPQVILLDQHGWEIMRMPMYTDNDFTVVNTEGLSKYNSPMVSEYQWYPSAAKVTGYHKYNISDPAPEINIYENSANPANNNKVEWHIVGSESFTSNSLAVTPDGNLTGYSGQDKKYKTDFYVTYTVKSEYDNAYTGAATSDAAVPSAYLLKQGGSYASTNGSAITATTAPASMEDIPNVMQWNLRPNFDIDREMGYKYAGEAGAQDGAKNKEATDQDNYDEGRNGFDPYNVQIKSVAYPLRYFTANTTGIALEGGAWKGTSDAVNLQNLSNKQTADGYDQTKLSITNATFMVVDDGTGNMRLMPRFDNSKVVTFSSSTSTPFTTLETQTTAATTGDKGTGTQTLWLELVPKATEVHFSSEMTDMNGHYLLAEDFTFDEGFTSLGTSDQPFRGIIDGQLNTLSGTSSVPLVAYAGGAIIRNVILEKVDISTGTNVGAICCEATGSTRIYNCGILGGSVGGSGDVGGIVGSLDGSARVINCYSYATITGGNNVGGIVGNNKGTTTASNINTMVMNCMFYGDITGGTTVSPVFGGNNIANLQGGLNTFNYYAYDKLKTKAISDNKYNSALAVEEKYLNRFEFYRLLLNSNKKLAAFYATGNVANADQMAKWVLETADRTIANPKPYPILKAQGYYPSIINIDAENAPLLILENDKPREEDRKKGGKLGKTLSVTISGVGSNAPTGASITNGSLTLQRTDKDFDRFNYNYDKVQLPYYNDVGTGNYTGNRVVTGWKITAITAVEGDPYTIANYDYSKTYASDQSYFDYPNYNFANRKSSNKDLYSVSKRVFSQGAYFDVPYGVTSITIEPYWGKAHYIADPNYDVVYKTDYKNENKQNVTQTGTQVANPTGTTPTMFIGQKVETSIERALNNINNNMGGWGPTVYDNALVLVGNLHLATVPQNGTTPFTMMSVDEDNDHEPDYSLIYHHIGRSSITPIRFDFLNIPGTAQAQKPNGASLICNFTIFKTRGWFEVTNTALFYTSQLEYENLDNNTKTDAPLILLGGVVDQFVSTQSKTVTGKTIYIHVGGNVWIKEFGMGTHSDGSESTPHVPVSVTGGEFPGFYLTGTYKADAKVRSDDAECYISGGYFHEVAGASLEQIDGNVHWQIYNADIDNFFGGGINDAKPIKGDITTDIYNSHVTLFCGGPKFGNMQTGMKVSTNAEGCTFGKYFGAGYGGTSIAKKKYYDKDGNQDWSTLQGYYINDRGKYFNGTSTGSSQISGKDYGKKGPGVATDFDYEFFVWTSGATGARLYVNFASFSLAQCNDVSSILKKCTVETNFYGGGNLGKVVGTATSVLEDCTVKGSVYGAGYSASLPTVEVRDGGFTNNPNFNTQSGMFEPGIFSGTTTFTWKNAKEAGVTLKDKESGSDLTNHILYTNTELTGLGEVAKTELTIKGTTTVAKSVYGGGEESGVAGNTEVNVTSGTIGTQGQGGVEYGNVFGGGKGKVGDKVAGYVKGNTAVNISQAENMTTTILHNVYGGGAYGSVGDFTYDATSGMPTTLATENTGVCNIAITGGTIGTNGKENGMIFGSSRGDVATPEGEPAVDPNDRMAWVYSTNVTIGTQSETPSLTTPKIAGSVYGSGENGHTFQNTEVTIHSGTIGIAEGETITDDNGTPDDISDDKTYSGAAYPYRGNVYGGGCGTDMYWIDANGNGEKDDGEKHYNPIAGIVRGNATVTIDGGHVVRNVYGAGAMGSVGDEAEAESASTSGKTIVTIKGKAKIGVDGNDNGSVYGAARGDLNVQAENYANVRETELEINENADIKGSAFGGGEAGIVWESVAVNMKGGSVANDVYGGGALANTQIAYTIPDNAEKNFTTNVNLTGGSIGHNVYGGGLGRMADKTKGVTAVEAKVYGKVVVALNGTKTVETVGEQEVTSYKDNCVVKGSIFGCNNQNGSPQDAVTVHIYKTTGWEGHAGTASDKKTSTTAADHSYHLAAVYGGGNLAAFIPDKASVLDTLKTHVIIDGCDMTSIRQVYGGGNAASVPATDVLVNGTYEIEEVFGGGNGKDDVSYDGGTTYIKNPGANVGYKNYSTYDAVNNEWNDKEDADTKSERLSSGYIIGTGAANVNINGGTIHRVFGGSNTKGNVRITAVTMLEEAGGCPFCVDEAYGGGKSAPMDAEAKLLMACIPGLKEAYGGAQNAEIDGDVTLNITNGTFERIFGGNDEKGYIKGTITVNIEETGCKPIIIGELYGGGNQAPYTAPEGKHGPTLNVRSFTSIGDIYGGGLGSTATVTGDTYVNINVSEGRWRDGTYQYATDPSVKVNDKITELNEKGYHAPEFTSGMGSIHTVFGGGNAAPVTGNTNVNVGTSEYEEMVSVATGANVTGYYTRSGEGTETSPYTYTKATGTAVEGTTYYQKVKGANITGNVYGGGNNAEVTGDTHVVIGEKYEAP